MLDSLENSLRVFVISVRRRRRIFGTAAGGFSSLRSETETDTVTQ